MTDERKKSKPPVEAVVEGGDAPFRLPLADMPPLDVFERGASSPAAVEAGITPKPEATVEFTISLPSLGGWSIALRSPDGRTVTEVFFSHDGQALVDPASPMTPGEIMVVGALLSNLGLSIPKE